MGRLEVFLSWASNKESAKAPEQLSQQLLIREDQYPCGAASSRSWCIRGWMGLWGSTVWLLGRSPGAGAHIYIVPSVYREYNIGQVADGVSCPGLLLSRFHGDEQASALSREQSALFPPEGACQTLPITLSLNEVVLLVSWQAMAASSGPSGTPSLLPLNLAFMHFVFKFSSLTAAGGSRPDRSEQQQILSVVPELPSWSWFVIFGQDLHWLPRQSSSSSSLSLGQPFACR